MLTFLVTLVLACSVELIVWVLAVEIGRLRRANRDAGRRLFEMAETEWPDDNDLLAVEFPGLRGDLFDRFEERYAAAMATPTQRGMLIRGLDDTEIFAQFGSLL